MFWTSWSFLDKICRENGIDYWLHGRHSARSRKTRRIHSRTMTWTYVSKRLTTVNSGRFSAQPPKRYRLVDYRTSPRECHLTWMRLLIRNIQLKEFNEEIVTEPVWIDVFTMINGTVKKKRFLENTHGKILRRRMNVILDGHAKRNVALLLYPLPS